MQYFRALRSGEITRIQCIPFLLRTRIRFLRLCDQYRQLEPLLRQYKTYSGTPSRVVWMSSLEARRTYGPDDWQLIQSKCPYEGSKYQVDLLAAYLDEQQRRNCVLGREGEDPALLSPSPLPTSPPSSSISIQHLLCHPGVVRTNIAIKSLNNNILLDYLMQFAFLLVCILSIALRYRLTRNNLFR